MATDAQRFQQFFSLVTGGIEAVQSGAAETVTISARPAEPAEWAQHDADLENSADLERWENDRAEGIR